MGQQYSVSALSTILNGFVANPNSSVAATDTILQGFDKLQAEINAAVAGGGTVTSVSVTPNQGVTGVVATATTTPAITLSLGVLTGVTSINGLVVTANTATVTTGIWNATSINTTYTDAKIKGTVASGFMPRASATDTLASGMFQDNGTVVGLNVAPLAGTLLNIKSAGNDATTYGIQIHNSTGNNYGFVLNDAGNAGMGAAPFTDTILRILTTLPIGMYVTNNAGTGISSNVTSGQAYLGEATSGTAGNFEATTGMGIRGLSTGATSMAGYLLSKSGAALVAEHYGATISADSSSITAQVIRNTDLNGHDMTGDLLQISDTTASTGNLFQIIKQTAVKMKMTSTGLVALGAAIFTPTAYFHIGAGTTANAQIRLAAGVAPTTPNDGDIYYIDTNDRLMFRKNATNAEILSASAVTTEVVVSDTTLTLTFNGTTYKILAKA